jgi:tetratricopeptide (TPR) repeat protein
MNEKDLITLLISGLALTISIYGIYERRSATHRAFRIRLTELIDGLAQLNVSSRMYLDDPARSETQISAFRAAAADRRALLAAQATDILGKYGGRVTVPEYVNLASALHEFGDYDNERHLWEKAVAARKETPTNMQAAWRGLAWCCFEQGDLDRARMATLRALEVKPESTDRTRLENLETIFMWFEAEFHEDPANVTYLSSLLDRADAIVRDLTHGDWEPDPGERLRLARDLLTAGEKDDLAAKD